MTANTLVVLNVDPSSVRRNKATRALIKAGYVVHAAESKEECLTLATRHRPDIVLLPWELSGDEGTNICKLLKGSVEPPPAVILRIPASPSSSILDCGADAFLPERASGAIVLATVASLLRLRQPQQDRVKEDAHRFAARVSHDLGEPLRMMTTFGQMLAEDSTQRLTPDEKVYLGYVLGGVERARRLLHYMLEYSRVGAAPAILGPVELGLVVTLARNSLTKRIEETGAVVEVEEPLPTVKGNAQELQKVMQALINNALKYHRPETSPRIKIKAIEHSPTEWWISVADEGIGIPQRFQTSIFEPFERLHGKEVPGCGMGLALAKRILETEQGRIWVESEPGQGSTFFLSLPRYLEEK